MKRAIQKLMILIAPALPFFVKHAIYLLPILKLKTMLFPLGISVWARNSVYFKDEVFGVSDLDISIYSYKKVSLFKKKIVYRILKIMKYFFPFMGEVIFYEAHHLRDFISYASLYELKRDPILLNKINMKNKDMDSLEKAFILNWMLNDYHRMDESILHRRNKIDRFLNILNKNPKTYISGEDVLMDLLKDFPLSVEHRLEWFEAIQRFLRAFKVRQIPVNDWLSENSKYEEIIALCFPQIWMGAAIHKGSFEDILYLLHKRGREEKRIFLEQISWELWGLYSNHSQLKPSAELTLHLDHLKQCVEIVCRDEENKFAQKLIEGVAKLQELFHGLSYE